MPSASDRVISRYPFQLQYKNSLKVVVYVINMRPRGVKHLSLDTLSVLSQLLPITALIQSKLA